MTAKQYEQHVFISFDVETVRDYLGDYENPTEDYPKLTAMGDDDLDAHLAYCARKGYEIWNNAGGLDLYELENLIRS